MATLDRFLTLFATGGARSLLLETGQLAQAEVNDGWRPVTKQPVAHAQLVALLREVAPPDAAQQIESGAPAAFSYVAADGTFSIEVTAGTGDPAPLSARVRRTSDASAPAAPPTPAPAVATSQNGARVSVGADRALERAEGLLRALVSHKASDLHLRVGEPPLLRVHGEIERIADEATLSPTDIDAILNALMPEQNRHEFAEHNDTDFAYEIAGVGRFRGNALRERKGPAAVFRSIPATVVSVEEMGVSEEVQRLCNLSKGLVLVTGPTGSGKSTTLCALIDLINRTRSDHVITIEDPIEFVHENKKCLITQRHVGVHTSSFKHALRAALREDPDIVLVGELRDLETVSIAIETAETGHLVFGTLHTTSAVSTVERVIDQFPPDRQEQIRVMLSESLKGVISQVLCKRIGGGRVAAREILLSMPSISNLIREGKTFQIQSVLQTSRRLGMVTMNDALMELVDGGLVEPKEAYMKATDKTGVVNLLRGRGHDTSFLDAAEVGNAPAASGDAARKVVGAK